MAFRTLEVSTVLIRTLCGPGKLAKIVQLQSFPMSTVAERAPLSAVRPKRVPELDGLRAFAILPVLLHHCYPFTGTWAWMGFFGEAGWMGVDLFFVLSGYLITGILADAVGQSHYYQNFIVRRSLRIFPLYYVCLILFTLAAWKDGSHWIDTKQWGIGWFVFYLGNIRASWLNQFPPVFSFVPLWSLQVEEQFYLLYPFIVLCLPRNSLRRFLIGCAVTAPVIRICLFLFAPGSSLARNTLMFCRMDGLALGGLVALLVRSPGRRWLPARLLRNGALAMGAFALTIYTWVWLSNPDTATHPLMSTIGFSINAVTFAVLLALIVTAPPPRFAALLRNPFLVYTGQIAYGLYLLHSPASWIARKLIMLLFGVEVPGHSVISVPVTFVASYVVAGLSWRYFESPILTLKDRLTYSSHA
jgi:peptidoglycan/LPS O-acetylase OafA/YrhL